MELYVLSFLRCAGLEGDEKILLLFLDETISFHV
jgi:hypothetical protein